MPTPVTMPALSPTMTDGTLAKWLKKEGDKVEAGDVIAEIETDKATMEVEAVDEGILGRILVKEGTEGVPVNDVIAVLLEEGEDKSALEGFDPKASNGVIPNARAEGSEQAGQGPVKTDKGKDPSASPSTPKGFAGSAQDDNKGARVFASPLAKRIAKEKGLNLSTIKGSGPHGRIVKNDVIGARSSVIGVGQMPTTEHRQPITGPDARQLADMLGMEYEAIPNNNIKKVTARRLTEAKQTIPHFYLTVECVLDNLLSARQQINEAANGAYKLSVNDFIIKAAAMALKAYPPANTAWTDQALLQFKHADISVAVATPNGLITPIVKKAEEKSLREISEEMKDLAARARDGKLKPQEFQGGTFSISNLGMFGVAAFNAIINPPQSCIMAVGAGEQKPVVENGEVKVRTVMNITLSTDHRSVDGAVGAEYLQHFKRFIENPVSLFA